MMSHQRPSRVIRILPILMAGCLILASCSDTDGKTPPDDFLLGDDLTLTANPESITFGAVPVGDTQTREIVLRHDGSSGLLNIESVTLVSDSSDFTISPPGLTSLKPSESTTCTLSYSPTDAEHDLGEIQISTNIPAPDGGTVTLIIPIVTLAQQASLIGEPGTVDFGPVRSKEVASKSFNVRSIGELPVTLKALSITQEGEDFSLVEAPELPLEIAPGDIFPLTVNYAPTGFSKDSGKLIVEFDSMAGPSEYTIELTGSEVWGILTVSPSPLDFGMRNEEQLHEQTVIVANEGTSPLTVSAIDIAPASEWSHTVGVIDNIAPFTLDVDETQEIRIGFVPDSGMPPSQEALAQVVFSSDDPTTEGETLLDVFGKRRGMGLEIYPPDILSFGFVGPGGTAIRTLSIYNASLFPINIAQVYLEGGFAFIEGLEYGPAQPEPVAQEIASGETVEITLVFAHPGGEWETQWGKVVVVSNDLLKPNWEVLLTARAADAAPCIVQLLPESTDMGFVLHGQSQTATVEVANIGGSTCGFKSAAIQSCPGQGECTSDAEPSSVFSVQSQPDVASDNLPPGSTLSLQISYNPPLLDEANHELTTHYGRLSLELTTEGQDAITVVPGPEWGNDPNVIGRTAKDALLAAPAELAFGEIPIGCTSEHLTVTVTNVGSAPVGIEDWELIDCDGHFKIQDYPVLDDPLPNGTYVKRLNPGEEATFLLSYTPDDEAPDTCALAVYHTASDQPASTTITGTGTFVTDHTDVFTDSQSQEVDVLFVVDDSGSMSQEQGNLAASFDAFIKKAAEWESDFQVGVVTTTVEFPEAGLLEGNPTFVSNANWEKFINNVLVGTNGSGHEQGLWAAKIALSSPLTDATDTPCESDSDCGFFHVCANGLCGGKNRGFMREGAALELVFVSDEQDQSPESADEYLKFFKSLKGFDRPDLLHIHAIVGPAGGCDSVAGGAVAGHPYLELAQSTGGVVYSICEQDFAKGLESIGEVAFSAKMRYFLTKLPAPTTIQVTIDGYPCAPLTSGIFNWQYDPLSNSVQLTEDGICKAEPGSVVEIYYQLLCFAD